MPVPRALVLPLLLVACATNPARRGPLPVRNQHPAQLTVMHLDPAPASALRHGSVEVRGTAAYSSLFLSGTGSNGNAFTMDGELLRTSVQCSVGLGAGFTASAELPFVLTTGGFLDSFLIDYHRFLGLPDQGRDAAPRDQFNVVASFQGQPVFQQHAEPLKIADVPLSLEWTAVAPHLGSPGFALRAGVELPTGNEDRGMGNGSVDTAIGAVAELPLDWATWFLQAQHSFVGSPHAADVAGFSFADISALGGGIELPIVDDLSALVQFDWETSTLRHLEIQRASHDQVLLWMGGRLRLEHDLFLEFSIGEDLANYISPDVTFWFGIAWLPMRR
jgi:hypothetical protein